MRQNVDALKDQIEAAFVAVPYPGDDNLTIGYNPLSVDDDEGVSDYFRHTSWHGHSVEKLRYHACALSFFTPEAYHYYVPAFIIADLEDPEAADVISDCIAFDFSPLSSSSLADRIALFSEPQIEAIKSYIDYVIVRDGDYGTQVEARAFLTRRLAG